MAAMSRHRRRAWVLAVAIVAIGLLSWWAAPHVRSTALLLDLTGVSPGVRRWLPASRYEVSRREVTVTTRHGAIAARLFLPSRRAGPTLVVFPGVHGGGIDEPRFVAMSQTLASTGATVVGVPVPDLREYRLTPRATDVIEDAITWAAADRDFAPQGRVGVVAVSFAGGLALVAAGRPGMDRKISALFALGPHADLPRVIRYLCLADGAPVTLAPPHDYGVALMLRASLADMVPAQQAQALDRALVTFLDASSAESTDRTLSKQLFDQARVMEHELPEPARTLMHGVNERDVKSLGTVLAPLAEKIGGHPALSPVRSPPTTVPVFLVHGAADNVIPSSESTRVAEYLRNGGNQRVDVLLTALISHANAQSAPASQILELVRFWTRMWRSFEE
jgi:dienelactone hydrolase